MQQNNIALRVSLGFALLAYLLPFASVSAFLLGSQSLSGLALAFGGENMSGGQRPPFPFVVFPLVLLIVAFLLSLSKKPLGRWIGAIPLVPVLIFSLLASNSGGNGFTELRWGLGLYSSLLASLAASIQGFMGRIAPKDESLGSSQSANGPQANPFTPEDQVAVNKVLSGYKLIIAAIGLLLVNVIAGLSGDSGLVVAISLISMLTAIVIGIFAIFRVGAVLRYEIPIRVVVTFLIILPLINLITLIVLAVKIAKHLRSIGIKVDWLGARKADMSQ